MICALDKLDLDPALAGRQLHNMINVVELADSESGARALILGALRIRMGTPVVARCFQRSSNAELALPGGWLPRSFSRRFLARSYELLNSVPSLLRRAQSLSSCPTLGLLASGRWKYGSRRISPLHSLLAAAA